MSKKIENKGEKIPLSRRIRSEAEALLVLGVGVFGIISTFFLSSTGGSKGMSVSVFPRVIYALMLIAGVGMVFSKNKYAPPAPEDDVPMSFLLVATAATYVYFLAVLYIGIIVSTVIFLSLLFIALSRDPKGEAKKLAISCVIGTALIWAIYVLGAGIFLPNPLLF